MATIAVAQSCSTTSSGTTATCTFPGATTPGSVVIVCATGRLSVSNETITGITHGLDTSFTLLKKSAFQGSIQETEAWSLANIVDTGVSLTVTFSGSRTRVTEAVEITGARLITPEDDPNTANGSGTAVNSGVVSAAQIDQAINMYVGCLGRVTNGDGAPTFSGETGSGLTWTEQKDTGTGGSAGAYMALETARSTTAVDATVTATATTSGNWAGVVAVLKELPAQQTLTIAPAGAGKGRVTSSPAGVSCGATCSSGYDTGQVVTLTAEPVYDSTFTAFSGDVGCSTGTVTMAAAVNCTATFAQKTTRLLTVNKTGSTGTGLVRSAGREIDCGAACASATYTYVDAQIDWLNAYPDAGSTFAGWTGAGCPAAGYGGSVTMSAARTCTALFKLQPASPSAVEAQLFHVRPDGNDANCTGLADAAYDGVGGPDPCAFKTITEAVNSSRGTNPFSCSNGDDIRVHGSTTYSEVVTTPSVCQCPSVDDPNNGPCVMQGDSAATIIDPGAGAAAITSGNTTGGNRTRYLLVRDLALKGGTEANFRCAVSRYCTETALLDLTLTRFAQFGPKINPPDSAIQFDASFSVTDGNIVDGVYIAGDSSSCSTFFASNGAKFCGTRYANGIYAGGTRGIDIRNVEVRDLRGQAGRMAKNSIVQDSVWKNIYCEDEAADDACFQNYDQDDTIYRRNLIESVHPATNQSYRTIKTRITAGSSSFTSGMTAYNNTFYGQETACVGTTANCPNNSWGSGLRRQVIGNDADGGGPQGTGWDEMSVVRCVFANATGEGLTRAIYTANFTNVNNTCPVAPVWKGDLFYNVDDATDPSGCTITLTGDDSTETRRPLDLDASRRPNKWSPACFPLGTAYTARDGDISDDWVGYSSGACASTAPVPSPAKAILVIISRLGPAGQAPKELWRYPLAAGEVIGLYEVP